MEDNTETINVPGNPFGFVEYERPELRELVISQIVLGAGQGEMEGSNVDFGAADGCEDYSGDYTDIDLD